MIEELQITEEMIESERKRMQNEYAKIWRSRPENKEKIRKYNRDYRRKKAAQRIAERMKEGAANE